MPSCPGELGQLGSKHQQSQSWLCGLTDGQHSAAAVIAVCSVLRDYKSGPTANTRDLLLPRPSAFVLPRWAPRLSKTKKVKFRAGVHGHIPSALVASAIWATCSHRIPAFTSDDQSEGMVNVGIAHAIAQSLGMTACVGAHILPGT